MQDPRDRKGRIRAELVEILGGARSKRVASFALVAGGAIAFLAVGLTLTLWVTRSAELPPDASVRMVPYEEDKSLEGDPGYFVQVLGDHDGLYRTPAGFIYSLPLMQDSCPQDRERAI